MLEEPETKTRPWWRTKPFLIMVIAGLFHLGRNAPVDGIVFLGTATALAATELRKPRDPHLSAPQPHDPEPRESQPRESHPRETRPREPRPREPRPRKIPTAAILIAIPTGWLLATCRPGTIPVTVAVALTGPPMLYLALAKGGHGERTNIGTWWPWAATGVAICLWELTSFLHQSDAQRLTPITPRSAQSSIRSSPTGVGAR